MEAVDLPCPFCGGGSVFCFVWWEYHGYVVFAVSCSEGVVCVLVAYFCPCYAVFHCIIQRTMGASMLSHKISVPKAQSQSAVLHPRTSFILLSTCLLCFSVLLGLRGHLDIAVAKWRRLLLVLPTGRCSWCVCLSGVCD
jgi:hypothetical protein